MVRRFNDEAMSGGINYCLYNYKPLESLQYSAIAQVPSKVALVLLKNVESCFTRVTVEIIYCHNAIHTLISNILGKFTHMQQLFREIFLPTQYERLK